MSIECNRIAEELASTINGGSRVWRFAGDIQLLRNQRPGPPSHGLEVRGLPATVHLNSGGSACINTGVLLPKGTAPGTYTITFNGVSGKASELYSGTITVTASK